MQLIVWYHIIKNGNLLNHFFVTRRFVAFHFINSFHAHEHTFTYVLIVSCM